jgi:hypothetical protein
MMARTTITSMAARHGIVDDEVEHERDPGDRGRGDREDEEGQAGAGLGPEPEVRNVHISKISSATALPIEAIAFRANPIASTRLRAAATRRATDTR